MDIKPEDIYTLEERILVDIRSPSEYEELLDWFYDVWITFGSVHEVRAFRERKKRSLWFREGELKGLKVRLEKARLDLKRTVLVRSCFLACGERAGSQGKASEDCL